MTSFGIRLALHRQTSPFKWSTSKVDKRISGYEPGGRKHGNKAPRDIKFGLIIQLLYLVNLMHIRYFLSLLVLFLSGFLGGCQTTQFLIGEQESNLIKQDSVSINLYLTEGPAFGPLVRDPATIYYEYFLNSGGFKVVEKDNFDLPIQVDIDFKDLRGEGDFFHGLKAFLLPITAYTLPMKFNNYYVTEIKVSVHGEEFSKYRYERRSQSWVHLFGPVENWPGKVRENATDSISSEFYNDLMLDLTNKI